MQRGSGALCGLGCLLEQFQNGCDSADFGFVLLLPAAEPTRMLSRLRECRPLLGKALDDRGRSRRAPHPAALTPYRVVILIADHPGRVQDVLSA